jgi:shikimate 5-dehydrogenase/shikimate kinase/3-dehydroquinate dehydratase
MQTEPRSRHFSLDGSLVLVGIRGAGKSTLAIIACSAMKRSMIDMEKVFQQSAGMSSSHFKKHHGTAACHARQAETLRLVLEQHATDCVIVCSWVERDVQALLQAFAATHPVIHVLREARAIQDRLKIQDSSKMASLMNASGAIFRSCSNLEFFNVTESTTSKVSEDAAWTRSPAPYLTLKRAERHFLKFVSLVMPGSIPFIESAFPLASLPAEQRQFTYAVTIPLSTLLATDVDIEAIETGADAIQIVIDYLRFQRTPVSKGGMSSLDPETAAEISRVVGIIRRSTVLPVILHVLPPDSLWESTQDQRLYLDLVAHGLRMAAEYVTIDLGLPDSEISRLVAMKRQCKIIAAAVVRNGGDGSWNSPAWVSRHRRAQNLGCDLVRLIRNADSMNDNFAVACFREMVQPAGSTSIPVIAYNSGPRGRHSACFNAVLTSVAPDLSIHLPRTLEDLPSLTAVEATKALFSSFVFDPMRLWVFGANVDYSLSPAMHNAALEGCGIPHRYQPFSTGSLDEIQQLAKDPFFAGASVGLPFKVSILRFTDSLSPHAKAIGAANTLIPVRQLCPDGTAPPVEILLRNANRSGPVKSLFGENTDWIGIRACIRRGLSPANAVRSTTCGLVVGAGGMARAAVYAMLQLGVQNIVIHNRTPSNAERLISHFSDLMARDEIPQLGDHHVVGDSRHARFHVTRSLDEPWPAGYRPPTVIISCIPTHPIGEVPAPNFTAPDTWLESPTGGVIIELGYKDLDTPLLRQARAQAHRGWVTMDGLDLLPEQGFAQFELFTGRRAPRRLMRRAAIGAYPSREGADGVEMQARLRSIPEQEP